MHLFYKSIIFDQQNNIYKVNQIRFASWKKGNYYDFLNVKKEASSKEIKLAYYKKCKELHPDSNLKDANSHDKFVYLNQAYSTLSSHNSRLQYDISLSHRPHNPFVNSNPYQSSSGGAQQSYYYSAHQSPFYNRQYEHAYQRDFNYWRHRATTENVYEPPMTHYKAPVVVILILVAFGIIMHYAQFRLLNKTSHGFYRAGGYSANLTDDDIRDLQERLRHMDEAKLDRIIKNYKEYEDRPLVHYYSPVKKHD